MGCMSAPSTKMKSTMDPKFAQQVYSPFVSQLGGQLFGTPATTQTTYSNWWDELLGRNGTTTTTPGTPGAFTGASPDWAYSGQRVADLTPMQSDTFNMAGSLGLQNTRDLLNGTWMSPITAQAQNLWNRTIMPSVMNQQSAMDSAGSGGTMDRLAVAGQDLSTQLAGQLAPLSLQASQIGMANLGNLSTQGMLQQQQAQNQLNASQQLWNEQQPWNHPLMQYFNSTGGMNQMTPVQQAGGMGYSALSGMAGGLGQGLGMLGMAMI